MTTETGIAIAAGVAVVGISLIEVPNVNVAIQLALAERGDDDGSEHWSDEIAGIAKVLLNRMRKGNRTALEVVLQKPGQGYAVWSYTDFRPLLARWRVGGKAYWRAFGPVLGAFLGLHPAAAAVGKRDGFVHRGSMGSKPIPEWNNENALLIGITTFSGPRGDGAKGPRWPA